MLLFRRKEFFPPIIAIEPTERPTRLLGRVVVAVSRLIQADFIPFSGNSADEVQAVYRFSEFHTSEIVIGEVSDYALFALVLGAVSVGEEADMPLSGLQNLFAQSMRRVHSFHRAPAPT